MNAELQRAADLLRSGGYTCVFCGSEEEIVKYDRGVMPLLCALDSGKNMSSFYAADKVVGKAAAFLYVLLGVRGVYADVISDGAVRVLTAHGIEYCYGKKTPGILRRDGKGMCPMETAVGQTDDPNEALAAIRVKLAELSKK